MAERPTSVTVMSIIGMVLAGMSTLGIAISYLSYMSSSSPVVAAMFEDPVYGRFWLASIAMTIVIVCVMWIGTISAMKMALWARRAMLTYAWTQIVVRTTEAAFMVLYTVPEVLDPLLARTRFAEVERVGSASAYRGFYLAGVVMTFLFSMAYPVAVLLVYNTKGVKEAFARRSPASAEPAAPAQAE